jgi:hypothetical protein
LVAQPALAYMNTLPAITPQLANPWRAAILVIFQLESYVELAVAHELAVNLKSPDKALSYKRGEYPPARWESEAKLRVQQHAAQLRSGLLASFALTLVFLAIGLLLGIAMGKISFSLPIAGDKWLSTVGSFLAGWATLHELGGYSKTIKGEYLHEIIHPVFFKTIFLLGLAIASLGQIW